MGTRRLARENALRILYTIDICHLDTEETLNMTKENKDSSPESTEFVESLVRGTMSNSGKIDKLISKYSKNWTIERMPSIDRNILRLATYELLKMTETPINVVINEAVEIAKRFSTIESGKFVNGVLDKIKIVRKKKETRK